jgi:hypothetical protein
VTVPPTATGFFLITTVTPIGAGSTARLSLYAKDALNGNHYIDIEIRDQTGALADRDFMFTTMERS